VKEDTYDGGPRRREAGTEGGGGSGPPVRSFFASGRVMAVGELRHSSQS
jgi:hypothetical protein